MHRKTAAHPGQTWLREPESNRRQMDYWSTALPTELSRHYSSMPPLAGVQAVRLADADISQAGYRAEFQPILITQPDIEHIRQILFCRARSSYSHVSIRILHYLTTQPLLSLVLICCCYTVLKFSVELPWEAIIEQLFVLCQTIVPY